jgi:formylglycine-generating enzyme required for sulfatase activity
MNKMKKMKKVTILLLTLLCVSVAWGQPDPSQKYRIAVYLTASKEVDINVKNIINNQIINALVKTDKYEMIERNEAFVQQIDKERVTQLSGKVAEDQIRKLGQEYGAGAICIADVQTLMGEISVDMRIVSVEKARVIRTGAAEGRYTGISDVRKIVDKATADMLGDSSGTPGGSNSSGSGNRPSTGKNLTFTANGVSFEMIFVEGGTFVMGCTSEQSDCSADEKPTHSVTLSDYYMGKYQVTQKLWQAVMGTNVRQQRDLANTSWPLRGEGSDYPMYYISYNECEEFCSKLNKLLANQLPEGYKFRLPTEAQWEYAARGGKKSKGYKYSGGDYIGEVAWYDSNSGEKTHEVGMKDKNELGIYDMSGNVWEWCQDWFDANYYSNSPSTNPKGPGSGSGRVLRGGSWYLNAQYCRVSFRNCLTPDYRDLNYGFRLSLVP